MGVKCDLTAVDLEFRTALHWAAAMGNQDITKLLLSRGSSPTATDAVGATPLHYAVSVCVCVCDIQ